MMCHLVFERVLFEKIRSSYLRNKNYFWLIFSPICSKLVSPLKKLFQFKKFGISHGLLFEFPHLVFLIQLVQLFFLSTGFDLIGAKSFYSCLIHGKINWLEVAYPVIRDGCHFAFGFIKISWTASVSWNFNNSLMNHLDVKDFNIFSPVLFPTHFLHFNTNFCFPNANQIYWSICNLKVRIAF